MQTIICVDVPWLNHTAEVPTLATIQRAIIEEAIVFIRGGREERRLAIFTLRMIPSKTDIPVGVRRVIEHTRDRVRSFLTDGQTIKYVIELAIVIVVASIDAECEVIIDRAA